MKSKVLIIEDNSDLSKMIELYLKKENYESQICRNGGQALEFFNKYKPDLILLDLMLPEINGLEILKKIRMTSIVPIIIISAKETETDRVLGLKLGADDYVVKPFSLKELMARIESQFRRQNYNMESHKSSIVQYNDIMINRTARTVSKNDRLVTLTTKEFDVLNFLVNHPAQVISKDQIYNQVWEFDSYGDINTVVIQIQKIREKLPKTNAITTVRGVGYRFDGKIK
ncbi:response regulator transcription factor [Xylocopilactobacillus apis]|uniref:DNA-binding response regulator n=1 Tax=Xylocopilactobacillus apis TaxID=2932183 RepID=A0AAU9DLX1_9LACO|nr:response regulator transcription factor [Xylocopilactobacillus apis]BDR56599.1 DNA-binding response regulator [Xylocopilactobacillus apis]